jgi:hypothetical protein
MALILHVYDGMQNQIVVEGLPPSLYNDVIPISVEESKLIRNIAKGIIKGVLDLSA